MSTPDCLGTGKDVGMGRPYTSGVPGKSSVSKDGTSVTMVRESEKGPLLQRRGRAGLPSFPRGSPTLGLRRRTVYDNFVRTV